MVGRGSFLHDLALADRRIARGEELVERLSKRVASLDPASRGAEVGRHSLELMRATLVSFRATRDHLRRRLGLDAESSSERENAVPADAARASDNKATRPHPALDPQQEEVLRALLNLEIRVDAPGRLDSLWMHAIQNDFRPEKDPNGPLSTALRQ